MKQPDDQSAGATPQEARKLLTKNMRQFLRMQVLTPGDEFGDFVERYAVNAARWTPTNWCLVLSQRPDMAHPITVREVQALGRTVKEHARLASIFVPIIKKRPDESDGEGGEGAKETSNKPIFILKRCVLDAVKDTEGDAPIVLPVSESATRAEERLALLELVTACDGAAPAMNTAEIRARGLLAAETVAFAHFPEFTAAAKANAGGEEEPGGRKVTPEDARNARIKLATYLILRAFGLPRPALSLEDVQSGWSGPRTFLQVLSDAARAMKEVVQDARQDLQVDPEAWSPETREQFVLLSDRAARAVANTQAAKEREMVDIAPPTSNAPAPLVATKARAVRKTNPAP